MKLKKYLKDNSITQEELIKLIEANDGFNISQGGISKYVIESRIPRKVEMHAIYKATQFNVSANDFYDLEPTSHNLFVNHKDKNLVPKKELAIELKELKELYAEGLLDKDIYKDFQRELLRKNSKFLS